MGCFSPKPGATKGDSKAESAKLPVADASSSRKSLDKKPVDQKDDARNRVHVPPGEEQKVLEQVTTGSAMYIVFFWLLSAPCELKKPACLHCCVSLHLGCTTETLFVTVS